MNRSFLFTLGILFAGAVAGSASADIISGTATLGATVQPAGPRSGANGTNYFNVEGASYSNNASYGVLDFGVSTFNLAFTATSISDLSLALTESNASFTKPSGGLNFYLVTDTTTSITNDGTSPLIFDANLAPEGFGTQLGANPFLLGSGTFSTNSGSTGSGTVDTYALTLNSNAQTYFLSQLNNSTATLRLVVTPTDATGASTWAGATNADPTLRPKLTFNATLDQPILTWAGGNGTWNATGGTSWSGGVWDPSKTAVFNTGSGTVTLGTPVSTVGLRFDVGGYTVAGSGANVLTLSSAAGGNSITVNGAANSAIISAAIAGTSGLVKNGDGVLALTGVNAFSGGVTINAGALRISTDANLGAVTNGIALNGGALEATGDLTVGAARTLSGGGSLASTVGTLVFAGAVDAGALSVTPNSHVTFSGTSAAFTSAALGAGSQLTVSAPVTSVNRTGFTGDGTVALNADNADFTGGFQMNKGTGTVGPKVITGTNTALGNNTLYLNAGELSAAINQTGANAINTPVSLGGSATLSGQNMQFSGGFAFYGSTAKRLTVRNTTTISTGITPDDYSTAVNTLIKAGEGKLTLSEFNTYDGGTQVLAGTLEVTATGVLGTGDVLVSPEGIAATVLQLDGNETIDNTSNIFLTANGSILGKIDLNFSGALFETVNTLTVDGVTLIPGDYNASNLGDYLIGTGNLRVISVPEPSVLVLAIIGLILIGFRAAKLRHS